MIKDGLIKKFGKGRREIKLKISIYIHQSIALIEFIRNMLFLIMFSVITGPKKTKICVKIRHFIRKSEK